MLAVLNGRSFIESVVRVECHCAEQSDSPIIRALLYCGLADLR